MNIYEFMSANPWLTCFIVACVTAAVCSLADALGNAFRRPK